MLFSAGQDAVGRGDRGGGAIGSTGSSEYTERAAGGLKVKRALNTPALFFLSLLPLRPVTLTACAGVRRKCFKPGETQKDVKRLQLLMNDLHSAAFVV